MVAVGAAIVYSGGMSFVLLKLIGLVLPLRADAADETAGLDVTQHGEEAYIHERGMTSATTDFRPSSAPGYASSPVSVS
jgi:ammonia channel protein AmtB